jgi:hypothetical protein
MLGVVEECEGMYSVKQVFLVRHKEYEKEVL